MKYFTLLIPFLMLFSLTSKAQDVCDTNLIKLDTLEFRNKLLAEGGVLLDVRTPEEWKTGYIKGAMNIDFRSETFYQRIDKLDKSKSYFVYCEVGGRSSLAAQYMLTHGFCKVFTLHHGIKMWKEAGYPVVVPPEKSK